MRALLAFLIVGLIPGAAALAECPPATPSSLADGQIGLFFDAGATQNCSNTVPAFTLVNVYVVARVPAGGIAEFESPTVLLNSGPTVVVAGRSVAENAGYEPLIGIDVCLGARRIEPSSCPSAQGQLLPLSVIQLLFLSPPSPSVLCFRSACESFGGVVARAPTYVNCYDGTTQTFTGWESMCLGIGMAPVAVAPQTWTVVKTLFVDE